MLQRFFTLYKRERISFCMLPYVSKNLDNLGFCQIYIGGYFVMCLGHKGSRVKPFESSPNLDCTKHTCFFRDLFH